MRYLILSDLHANLEALDAVLSDLSRRSWDRCLVLGDVVGYGADPGPVIDRLRDLAPDQMVRGNHDKVVCGVGDGEYFNPLALEAARWTRQVLSAEDRRWLEEMPQGPTCAAADPGVVLSHGSPLDEEAYILGQEDALVTFEVGEFERCLFGHTHYPMVIGLRERGLQVWQPPTVEGGTVPLEPGRRYLINPGSVGQPRDGNPRASYVVLDAERHRVEFHRLSYPVEITMAKIVEAGLPAPLAARLPRGV